MPKQIPQIREFMTHLPHTVDAHDALTIVQRLMKEYDIRHMPVQKNGKLVGIVSERTIKSALSLPNSDKLMAEDLVTGDPLVVLSHTPLDEVAARMADEKFGSVLVEAEDGKLVGIFTTVDACRALRQLIEMHYPE